MMRAFVTVITFFPSVLVAQPGCDIANLQWNRIGPPVLRDVIPKADYEAASDPHVFYGQDGSLHMIYSGDDDGFIAIKHATGTDMDNWSEADTLLGLSRGHESPLSKETPFYRLSETGEHQIYFIGYENEETYEASVYLAVSSDVTGPYTVLPEPVVPRGSLAGREVHLITSPSVVSHDGQLFMAFLGWNGFEDVTEVWVLGAISTDDGRTWQDVREIDVPIGMEGQITPTPDGSFVATRTGEFNDDEGIGIGCADHPFGPYSVSDKPVLQRAGPPWEVDEIIAPQITFDRVTGLPQLFYTGANYAKGWWIMRAFPASDG